MADNNASVKKNCKEVVYTTKMHNEDQTKRLEKRYGGKRIIAEELKSSNKIFHGLLKTLAPYGNIDRVMILIKDGERITCLFYTANNKYNIQYRSGRDNDKGYIGCVADSRKALVGEDWTRGKDLPDGNCSIATWNYILNKIISYEMKNLQLWK